MILFNTHNLNVQRKIVLVITYYKVASTVLKQHTNKIVANKYYVYICSYFKNILINFH